LLVRGQDEQVDELALREASLEEPAEPLPQEVRVPQRPLRIGAVSLDVGLMVGLAYLVEKDFELARKIRLHQHFLLIDADLM
jgi:hypothetical protein